MIDPLTISIGANVLFGTGFHPQWMAGKISEKIKTAKDMKKIASRYSQDSKIREYLEKRVQIENKEIELMRNILVAQKTLNKLIKKKYKKEKNIWIMKKNVDIDVLKSIYKKDTELSKTVDIIDGLHKRVSNWHSVKKEKNILHAKLINDANTLISLQDRNPNLLELYTDFTRLHEFYSKRLTENNTLLSHIKANQAAIAGTNQIIKQKTITNIAHGIEELIKLEESELVLESNILEKLKNCDVSNPYDTIQEIIGEEKLPERKSKLKWLVRNSRRYDKKFNSHLKHRFGGFTLKHSYNNLGKLSKKMKKLSSSRKYKMYNSLLEAIESSSSSADILSNIEQRKNEMISYGFRKELEDKFEEIKDRSVIVVHTENNLNQKKQDIIKRKNDGERVEVEEKKLAKVILQIEKYKETIKNLYNVLQQSINENTRLYQIFTQIAYDTRSGNTPTIDANEIKSIVKKIELLLQGVTSYEHKLESEDLRIAAKAIKEIEEAAKVRENEQKVLTKFFRIAIENYSQLRKLILSPGSASASKLYAEFISEMQTKGLRLDDLNGESAILNSSLTSLTTEAKILDKDRQTMELLKQRMQILGPLSNQKYKAWETYHKRSDAPREGTVGHWAKQIKTASSKTQSTLDKI